MAPIWASPLEPPLESAKAIFVDIVSGVIIYTEINLRKINNDKNDLFIKKITHYVFKVL